MRKPGGERKQADGGPEDTAVQAGPGRQRTGQEGKQDNCNDLAGHG